MNTYKFRARIIYSIFFSFLFFIGQYAICSDRILTAVRTYMRFNTRRYNIMYATLFATYH